MPASMPASAPACQSPGWPAAPAAAPESRALLRQPAGGRPLLVGGGGGGQAPPVGAACRGGGRSNSRGGEIASRHDTASRGHISLGGVPPPRRCMCQPPPPPPGPLNDTASARPTVWAGAPPRGERHPNSEPWALPEGPPKNGGTSCISPPPQPPGGFEQPTDCPDLARSRVCFTKGGGPHPWPPEARGSRPPPPHAASGEARGREAPPPQHAASREPAAYGSITCALQRAGGTCSRPTQKGLQRCPLEAAARGRAAP